MDIRLLKQFVAIYEERNISRAAARNYVSQPALSNSIRQLEEELGCLLFNRSKQGVTPTTQAEQLYPMALHMVGELDNIPRIFQKKQTADTLTLAVMPELPQQLAANLLGQIHKVIPDIQLVLTTLDQDCEGKIILDVMKAADELFLPLWREEYVFCCNKDHPLASHQKVDLEDLDNVPFIICPPCEAHQRTLGALGQKNISTNIIASVQTKQQVVLLLLANIGVSFLPETMAKEWSQLTTRPFEGMTDYRQVGLAWVSSKIPSPALGKVLATLQHQQ